MLVQAAAAGQSVAGLSDQILTQQTEVHTSPALMDRFQWRILRERLVGGSERHWSLWAPAAMTLSSRQSWQVAHEKQQQYVHESL
jgi:hypothetical protein